MAERTPSGSGATTAPSPQLADDRRWLWLLARLWLCSRLALGLVLLTVMTTQHRRLSDALGGWDVQHFQTIARDGYEVQLERAFFPGLPLLLRAADAVGLPVYLAGALLAVVCSALAAVALFRLAGGGPAGVVAGGLWLVAPTTVFTTVAYTEAPFCALAFWAWQRGTRGRWGQAAALAMLACTFRVSGLFLVGGLGLLALTQHGVAVGRRLRNACLAALGLLGVIGYFVYLHGITGSWTAWFDAQAAGWNRGFFSPRESLRHTLEAGAPGRWPGRPEVAWVFRAEVVSMVVGALLSVLLLWRRRWAQAGYVGVQVFAFATSYWFMSVNRAVLLWFPLWLLAAAAARHGWGLGDEGLRQAQPTSSAQPLASARPSVSVVLCRAAVTGLGLVSVPAMLWWAWLFYSGAWAS